MKFSDSAVRLIGFLQFVCGTFGALGAAARVYYLQERSTNLSQKKAASGAVKAHIGAIVWFSTAGLLLLLGFGLSWCAQRWYMYSGL